MWLSTPFEEMGKDPPLFIFNSHYLFWIFLSWNLVPNIFPSRGLRPYQPLARPMPHVSTSPSSLVEVTVALHSFSNNKAPRVDRVTTKLLKFGGPNTLQWLHLLIIVVWESRVVPSQWKRARCVIAQRWPAHHGQLPWISLLGVCGKVYSTMLHQHMQPAVEALLDKSQMCFCSVRTTTDAT